MTATDYAVRLAAYGMRVFPLRAGGKSPMPGIRWKAAASDSESVIRDWDRQYKGKQNWGVALGDAAGLRVMAVDLDDHDGIGPLALISWLSDTEADEAGTDGDWTTTASFCTAHGGVHLLWDIAGLDAVLQADPDAMAYIEERLRRSPSEVLGTHGFEGAVGNAAGVYETDELQVDVRMPDRGYIVAPGSVLDDGGVYSVMGGSICGRDLRRSIRPLPSMLAAWLIVEHELRRVVPEAHAAGGSSSSGICTSRPRFVLPDVIPEHGRNSCLYRYARSLVARDVDARDVGVLVRAANSTRCAPPLPDMEVESLIRHCLAQPPSSEFMCNRKKNSVNFGFYG